MGVIPGESLALASEVGKRACGSGIVVDPDPHKPCSAEEGMDIGD